VSGLLVLLGVGGIVNGVTVAIDPAWASVANTLLLIILALVTGKGVRQSNAANQAIKDEVENVKHEVTGNRPPHIRTRSTDE
jgi:hypothetical protein